MRPLQKIIDLEAFAHNVQALQKQAPQSRMVTVVKADAYGHGVANLLPALKKLETFAVACIEEALALRALGLTQPVWLLEGVFAADELPLCAAQGFVPWIHNAEQWQWLQRHAPGLPHWLKVDSGMHRLGFAPHEVAAMQGVRCMGIATHFACADEADLTHARGQLTAFQEVEIPAGWQRCAANSAATFALPAAHFDWVRPGLALYGMSPFAHRSAADLGLRPVMTLATQILATHWLTAGESAGYGAHFTAQEDGYLATIALGYGDGFARQIASGTVHVRIGGKTCPLVGRVAMDMCLVWLGKEAMPVGERVTIFGDGHAVEDVAAQAGTIPYTLTTMLTPRVPALVKG
ncbi:MAG: alanine racemase [Cardiobacteriaceae bacterium]|nr:alanine racemase [Cardiobacteriaceae bacterium]